MESKQVEFLCPCCSSRLVLDLRTQKVVRSQRPAELDSQGKPKVGERDWGQALGKVQDREQQGEGRLEQALRKEKDKARTLDELFRKAGEGLGNAPREGED